MGYIVIQGGTALGPANPSISVDPSQGCAADADQSGDAYFCLLLKK
jgi:hypothetical protein